MQRSLGRGRIEVDDVALHSLDALDQSCHEPFETLVEERFPGIIFIAGNQVKRAKVQQAAELARSSSSLLIGLVSGTNLTDWGTARSLRLMHRFCDTVMIVGQMESASNSGLIRLEYSDVVLQIRETLANASCRKLFRSMLRRGQLARVTAARSNSNTEEALLRALRALLPVTEFSRKPEVFLHISGQETNRKNLNRASRWITRALQPSNTIISMESDVETNIFLVATGIAFPHSPSSRKLSITLDELEPESDEESELALALGLDQIE